MASSKLQIWNMALGYLKNKNSIEDENENSFEAKQCRIYYDTVIGRVLRAHLWGFAKRQVTLALTGTAPTGWEFQYAFPTDAIKADRIFNPVDPQDSLTERVAFEIANDPDGSGTVIWTNQKEAQFVYGINVTDTTLWTPDFDDAAALLLGSKLGFSISNQRQRAADLRNLYFEAINESQTNNVREGTKNVDNVASWTEDRQ